MSLGNRFDVPGSLMVERVLPKGETVPYYVCWRPHISCFANTIKEVLKFARWPASTPTGAALREWLNAEPEQQRPEPNDQTKTII